MSRDPKEILEVFDRLKSTPSFLARDAKLRPVALVELLNPDVIYYLVDDVGMVAIYPDSIHASAHAHITFWDKRLRGRETLCREIAREVMKTWRLEFIWTVIPFDARATLAFAKRMGFWVFKEFDTFAGLMLTAQELT